MSDARWADVEADIASAIRHFGNAVELYCEGGFEGDDLSSYRASMALMHAMQSGHTSAEAGLMRILQTLGEEHPTGADWHEVLIRRLARPLSGTLARPAILPADIAAALQETRRFRHRAMHSYGEFDASRFGPTLGAAECLRDGLWEAIRAFKDYIDPDA